MQNRKLPCRFGVAFPLLTLVLTTLVEAQTSQYGNVKFDIPSGWQRLEQGQFAVLAPNDLTTSEKLIIVISPGQELTSDFRAAFEATLQNALAANEKLVGSSETQLNRENEGYDVLTKTLTVENVDDSNRTIRLYIAANPGKRLEMIVILANDQALFKKYETAVQAFITSCTFANFTKTGNDATVNADKPVGNPPSSNRYTEIEGLYVANILQNVPKTFGFGYEYRNFNVFWLLLSGGRIYFGLPDGDPAQFDFERAGREKPEKCGTYQISNSQIQLQWRGKPVSFNRGQELVDLSAAYSGQTGRTFFRRVSSENGVRLNGVFARRSFAHLSSAITDGGVSGETRFSFSSDGRFTIEGFIGFSASTKGRPLDSGRDPTAITPASPNGNVLAIGSNNNTQSGTYQIRNNVLELTYADGHREGFFFFRVPQEEDKVICINGTNYLRSE